MKKSQTTNDNTPSGENIYYYMENGLIVFTEAYLLKRGYCCKRICRHCPYGNSPKDRAVKEK